MTTKSTQVARLNLTLRGPGIRRIVLFKAFDKMALAETRWQRSNALEVRLDADDFGDKAIVFSRQACDGLPAVNLLFELRPYGCCITDIVSLESEPLSSVEYNALTEDFLARIGAPAAAETGFKTEFSTAPVRTHLETRSEGELAEFSNLFSNEHPL